jgi:glycosyltransferase involved in cell wall biosynthesis
VLQAIAAMGVGGAERVVAILAAACADAGDTVGVVAAPGELDRDLPPGVTRFPLAENTRQLRTVPPAFVAVRRAITRFRPEVVHVHNPRMTGIAVAARLLSAPGRPPAVLATHHNVMQEGEERVSVALLAGADRTVAVSQRVADRLREHGLRREKLDVIPNGTPPMRRATASEIDAFRRDLGVPDDGPIVAAVGRLVPAKGHDRLIEAAARLADRGVHAHFVITGGGPLEGRLRTHAARLGLERNVHVTGLRRDLAPLFGAADVLVFTSLREGLPIAGLEAMSVGLPIVCTDVGELPSILRDGAGLVTEAGPASVADAIARLLSDRALHRSCAEAAQAAYLRAYGSKPMVDAYRSLYRQLIRAW